MRREGLRLHSSDVTNDKFAVDEAEARRKQQHGEGRVLPRPFRIVEQVGDRQQPRDQRSYSGKADSTKISGA